MVSLTDSQRNRLRQRLLAWIASQPGIAPEETISDQIDHLLDEVLHEPPPAAAPLIFEPDEDEADQRIVITGMGLITPFGVGIAPLWAGVSAGQSAIGPITLCNAQDLPCQIAGESRAFVPPEFLTEKDVRHMARSSQFAIGAAHLALSDARLTINEDNADDVGVVVATSATSFQETEQAMETIRKRGPHKVSPFFLPAALPHMPAAQVAMQFGLRGHVTAVSTACAASAQAIGEATEVLRRGDARIMLAGGSEASIARLPLAGFCALRALSTRNHDPAGASRPFDIERDGFVPAEGAGVLVLERLTDARRRGAPIYGEIMSYASTCDAYHVTQPDPHGNGAALALQRALRRAHLAPQQIDYINAHATGTSIGDIAETRAIKHVFGEYAWSVPISASKSMFGHLMAAAGVVETAVTVLALHHQLVPPTINLHTPDPECDLDYVAATAREAELQTAICNSFGFGGINAVLVLRRLDRYE